ncbi:hypothetical protein [Aequorivita vladivostokensis]|jgi:hypothetical protein|uniref:DUF1735 domain-containing protein n=1 Tax=Aequorivita vladivostokensis TaxID=171194 RepID=A0ABR5DMI4_9FLAO|nr:hypothetical protein [Aequorivita vladivostokensis]KJJ40016.1 hypothetical protein MB09_02375 [Aequorivita vladivostokensis]MAB58128.1 hypothetical protein [Aequorivita sp.]MAO47894.1 hypothetical protein [Aequorivita sp.]MBF31034.1 hypothetical protein [Aequorivita sp.]|tara:strand:+ start:45999 stop:46421 length:423 start_codon:yes stop_codon:yes gene_type:complete
MGKIKILITIITLTLFVSSCETYDDYDVNRATIAGFTLANANIKVPNGGTRDKSVDIFVSDVSSVDRTFTISVVAEETEVAPENYSFDPTIVILANQRSAEFVLTGIDVSLTEEKLPLTLQVDPVNGIVSGGRLTAQIYK